MKVDLGQKKGKIVVEFASIEDLERILGSLAPGEGPVLEEPAEDERAAAGRVAEWRTGRTVPAIRAGRIVSGAYRKTVRSLLCGGTGEIASWLRSKRVAICGPPETQ